MGFDCVAALLIDDSRIRNTRMAVCSYVTRSHGPI